MIRKKPPTDWRHEDVFPLIDNAIRDVVDATSAAAASEQIVGAMLADRLAMRFIQPVATARKKPPEWVAANMVSWFSAQFTLALEGTGDQRYVGRFTRSGEPGAYSYQPQDE
jgi:hypothetical protein